MEKRFKEFDKDGSGELTKADVMVMLLSTEKKQTDLIFKMNLKFLINCIKEADKNDDSKISLQGTCCKLKMPRIMYKFLFQF